MKLLVDFALGDTQVPGAIAAALATFGLQPTPAVLVVVAALASLAIFVVNSVLNVGLSLSWTISGQRMVYDLAGDLFARLARMSLLFHSRHNVGDSLSRLSEDTWCIYSVTDGLLMSPLRQAFTLSLLAFISFSLDPVLAGLSLAMAPLLGGSSAYFGRRLKQRAKLGREAKSRLLSFVHQTLGAIPIVQAFGSENRNSDRFQGLADDVVALSQKGKLLSSAFGLVNGGVVTAGTAAVLYVGGSRVLSGAISLGTLLVFLAYVRQMQGASKGLFETYAKLKAAEASIDRIVEVLESSEVIQDEPKASPLPRRRGRAASHVRIENVTVGYEPGRPVLKGLSIEARPGEVVGLVGATGAGKSTVLSLIPRFLDPWEGRITFDGHDIRHATLSSVRAQLAVVLQDPFLLPRTVAENIAYSRPDASQAEIREAAVAAEADDFIRQLADGYDTVIGERGATLSGGERQRIAIARALLRDAPILLLDEPTSALDVETEIRLLRALERLMEGRTTLVVAHRLSTIRRADRIVVLDGGRVVEQGTHDELLRAGHTYKRLYASQNAAQAQEVIA